MEQLLECPCCGKSVAVVGTVQDITYGGDDTVFNWARDHFQVVCDYTKGGCGMTTGSQYITPGAAIAAWNRRTGQKVTKGKPETDLAGKCGSCIWAEDTVFCGSECYVRCIHPDLRQRAYQGGLASRIKARTAIACKRRYEPRWIKEEAE